MSGIHTAIGLGLAVLFAACGGSVADESAASDTLPPAPPPLRWVGTFAFANSAGTELLALEPDSTLPEMHWAVCGGAKRESIHLVRRQAEDPASTHRQLAYNFARTAGDVYAGSGAVFEPDGTCFLTPDSVLAASTAPYTPAKTTPCTTLQHYAISARNGRLVESCEAIGGIGPGNPLIATELSVRDSSALASLVLFRYASPLDMQMGRPTRMLFYDQRATYRGPGEDIWRVDDGGKFRPEDFTILFAGQVRETFFLGVTWAGAEGQSASFVVADSLDAFRVVKSQYRYWSPL